MSNEQAKPVSRADFLKNSPYGRRMQEVMMPVVKACGEQPNISAQAHAWVTIAICAALGREGQMRVHIGRALRSGTTPDEMTDVLLHVNVYAGMPAGAVAFTIFLEELEKIEKEKSA